MEFKGPQCIALSGFSLHAARRVGSEDRRNLSQLINYMARPPIAEDWSFPDFVESFLKLSLSGLSSVRSL